jgi:hypothetical protein
MLTVMRGEDARRRGTAARASISARDRGVEGNSVDAILGDVMRQEGEAVNVMAMNRSASIRALNQQAVAVDAQGDQQLASCPSAPSPRSRRYGCHRLYPREPGRACGVRTPGRSSPASPGGDPGRAELLVVERADREGHDGRRECVDAAAVHRGLTRGWRGEAAKVQ